MSGRVIVVSTSAVRGAASGARTEDRSPPGLVTLLASGAVERRFGARALGLHLAQRGARAFNGRRELHLRARVEQRWWGRRQTRDDGIASPDGIARLEIDPRRVAVEHNLNVVKRGAYDATEVRDGDQIEIVNFVGGG